MLHERRLAFPTQALLSDVLPASAVLPLPHRYVVNVFEELDAPGEYFYDPVASRLYVFYNGTAGSPPPPDFSLVATQVGCECCLAVPSLDVPCLPTHRPSQLEVFFNLTGSAEAPVQDVTFAGLAFRDQAPGQLEQWYDPSGGDWGLRR